MLGQSLRIVTAIVADKTKKYWLMVVFGYSTTHTLGYWYGAQESILKAVISTTVSRDKRATVYGIFYTVFGLSWFIGSSTVGLLYGFSIKILVSFSVMMELLGIVMLFIYEKALKIQQPI